MDGEIQQHAASGGLERAFRLAFSVTSSEAFPRAFCRGDIDIKRYPGSGKKSNKLPNFPAKRDRSPEGIDDSERVPGIKSVLLLDALAFYFPDKTRLLSTAQYVRNTHTHARAHIHACQRTSNRFLPVSPTFLSFTPSFSRRDHPRLLSKAKFS
jgi:hypothetical protein